LGGFALGMPHSLHRKWCRLWVGLLRAAHRWWRYQRPIYPSCDRLVQSNFDPVDQNKKRTEANLPRQEVICLRY